MEPVALAFHLASQCVHPAPAICVCIVRPQSVCIVFDFCVHHATAVRIAGLREGPATAMAERRIDDPDANPEWVLNVKKRQPRHQSGEEVGFWFIDKNMKAGLRWAAAEHYMESVRSLGHRMRMQEVFEEIRKDLGLARACWNPHKWTTMVQGRPVQAH